MGDSAAAANLGGFLRLYGLRRYEKTLRDDLAEGDA
jgi:hypothetical protein